MAIRTAPTPVPETTHSHDMTAWSPSPGMKFSTVRVVKEAFVAVEHPDSFTNDQLLAAVVNRRPEIVGRAHWYGGDNAATVTEIHPGMYEPDDMSHEPHALTEADLTAPPAPTIVETPAP